MCHKKMTNDKLQQLLELFLQMKRLMERSHRQRYVMIAADNILKKFIHSFISIVGRNVHSDMQMHHQQSNDPFITGTLRYQLQWIINSWARFFLLYWMQYVKIGLLKIDGYRQLFFLLQPFSFFLLSELKCCSYDSVEDGSELRFC